MLTFLSHSKWNRNKFNIFLIDYSINKEDFSKKFKERKIFKYYGNWTNLKQYFWDFTFPSIINHNQKFFILITKRIYRKLFKKCLWPTHIPINLIIIILSPKTIISVSFSPYRINYYKVMNNILNDLPRIKVKRLEATIDDPSTDFYIK
jgi:hypothetical protein